jgi:hypothetical protein
MPHLGNAGVGISAQRPHLGDAGADPYEYYGVPKEYIFSANPKVYKIMRDYAAALENTRVFCGDWTRMQNLMANKNSFNGTCVVVLDPPYAVEDRAAVYDCDDFNVSVQVRDWLLNGKTDRGPGKIGDYVRIAFFGYDTEMEALEADGWEVVAWKASGGYARKATRGRRNAGRERVAYSPACLKVGSMMFENLGAEA